MQFRAYSEMLPSDWLDRQTKIFCLQDPFLSEKATVFDSDVDIRT